MDIWEIVEYWIILAGICDFGSFIQQPFDNFSHVSHTLTQEAGKSWRYVKARGETICSSFNRDRQAVSLYLGAVERNNV